MDVTFTGVAAAAAPASVCAWVTMGTARGVLLLFWILLLPPAPLGGSVDYDINSIDESGHGNSTQFQVFVGYSSDPWGPSSELQFEETVVDQPKTGRKPKRSVVHLYNMVVCATGCNPLSYKGYGCYCGFLGSGYAMDPIDRCCKMHDWCYSTSDCPMFLEYFVPYYWTCYRHRPLCALGSSCGQRLCECDRRLAECLSHYPCPRTKAVCTSSTWRLLQNLLML